MNQEMVWMENLRDVGVTLESKSFKISRIKTTYINCNFSGHMKGAETTVRIEAHKIKKILSVTLAR